MFFGVLGQLLVDNGVEKCRIPAPKQRIILAALIFGAGRVVSVDELADLVWNGAPPQSWRAAVHNYMARLRRSLGPAGPRLVTSSPGYLLECDEAESDWRRFDTLARQSRSAAETGCWDSAAISLGAALALWRGMPLADVPSEPLRREWVPTLTEQWLQLVEWRIESDLRLGRDQHLVIELRRLATAYPLRERFHSQLMLALCRGGRQAEALTVYRDARRLLVTELGIEPGPELRRIQRWVLDGEADLISTGLCTRSAPIPEFADAGPGRGLRAGAEHGLLQDSHSTTIAFSNRDIEAL